MFPQSDYTVINRNVFERNDLVVLGLCDASHQTGIVDV